MNHQELSARDKRFTWGRLAGTCALLAVAAMGAADTITTTDGKVLEGSIDKMTLKQQLVTIRTSSGSLSIPQGKIAKIVQESEATNSLRVADQHLALGKYQDAANEYRKALQADPSLAAAKEGLAKAEAALNQLATDQQEADKAGSLETLKKVKELISEKKFTEAINLLRGSKLSSDPTVQKEYQELVADGSHLYAVYLVDKQDPARAVEMLQLSLKLNPDNEDARKLLVELWGNDPTKLDKVAAELKKSKSPKDQLKLADTYFRQKKYEDALRIYVKYSGNPADLPAEISDRIRRTFELVQSEFAMRSDWDKAIATYELYMNFNPEADPVPLARYQCKKQAAATDMSDADAVAMLGHFVQEHGFADHARKIYAKALELNPNQAVAKEGLQRLADAQLAQLSALVQDGQYTLVSIAANDIVRDYAALPDVVKSAQNIQATGAKMQAKEVADKGKQAQAWGRRGDEYYSQAQSYIGYMTSSDVNKNVRVFSPKQEAVKYLGMAIQAWQSALQLDPSLGDPISMDLNNKLAQANGLYTQLTWSKPPYMPRYEMQ
ncbi:MAG: tetratricopeptide repeat protein [Candidatus Sumerlaeaceae bacterium]|nr:tetratricopeptide repeat protein [Candidatus Sumerlaeaceae bacterium]